MGSAVIVLDAQGRVMALNSAAEDITGWTASQAVGRQVTEVLHSWAGTVEPWPNLTEVERECVVDTRSGKVSYELHSSPLTDSSDHLLGRLIIIRDITERKRTQAELLKQQRALAAMEERDRLARELHDDLGQVLGYLNVQAQAAREQLAKGEAAVADGYLERLVAVVQDAYVEVQDYVRGARGAVSPAGKFVSTLKQFLRRFERNSGIHADLAIPGEFRGGMVDPAAEAQLLRIIQEALSNVRKHAAAQHVRVEFEMHLDGLHVTVEDDGRGFDPAAPGGRREGGGFGLGIMRERAREIGGSLEINSTPGRGTRVNVPIPLGRNRETGAPLHET